MDAPIIHQNIQIYGDNNLVPVAGRDLNFTPPPLKEPKPGRPRSASRRLGKYATGGLAFVASLVFALTQIPNPTWPEGKTARCRDGWYSASHHRSGTCSSHGGVAQWRFPANHPVWRG